MTEEQKAEEYAKNILKYVTCNIGHPRARQINSIDIQDAWLDGYHECQKEHEWHYDGVPDITHKSCLVNVDYLPNIMLCFWNGEVWIEPRTLERVKKVKAWKYVDFPQELKNGKERT